MFLPHIGNPVRARKNFCNIPIDFFREIKCIKLYDAEKFTYYNNLKYHFPNESSLICSINTGVSNFERSILNKINGGNDFFQINIKFLINDYSLIKFHKNRKYTIVLETNKDKLILGNKREPLSMSISDDLYEDGTGKDYYTASITGETIIRPKLISNNGLFRVLLFGRQLI